MPFFFFPTPSESLQGRQMVSCAKQGEPVWPGQGRKTEREREREVALGTDRHVNGASDGPLGRAASQIYGHARMRTGSWESCCGRLGSSAVIGAWVVMM